MDAQPKRRWINWWMVGFIVSSLAFELAREIAVYEANEPIAGESYSFTNYQGYVSATGQWIRSDAGERILPVAVSITCSPETNSCTEATTVVFDGVVKSLSTDIGTYDAVFTKNSITYANSQPTCVTYRVQMDISQRRVTATRERNQGGSSLCDNVEKRVAMELLDGPMLMIRDKSWMEGHFLPLLTLVQSLTT
jgi:hypothetical protein